MNKSDITNKIGIWYSTVPKFLGLEPHHQM